MKLDVEQVRSMFPALQSKGDTTPPVYLDSAAQSLIVQASLNAVVQFETSRANVHRGMYPLAEQATGAYENARRTVQPFLHAAHPQEIVFTKNGTEGTNLVAQSWGRANLQADDAVVLSILEHHSNVVPWLQLKREKGIRLEWIDCDKQGNLGQEQYRQALQKKNVKLVTLTGQSNVLGVRPPLKKMIQLAHEAGAITAVDAAQLVVHYPIDVQNLDCDFLTFSGHKIYGPTGIGVLYGKRAHLETMPPFLGGGSMIQWVEREDFTTTDIPTKFEAGTPPTAQAVGLAAALQWLTQYRWEDIERHEQRLFRHAQDILSAIKGVQILSPATASGCLSFTLDGIHPHDVAEILSQRGVCMRAGHHCAQPLHDHLGIPGSVRLSIGIYNTEAEIDCVAPALKHAIHLFSKS